jgi:polyferredoxin
LSQPICFHRLLSLDIRTAGGIVGASVTLLTLLDFAFLRQRFCTAICPYGYLQGMLADSHTLLVHYQDESTGKVHPLREVRTRCPMGIDIRRSSNHQLSAPTARECIDACSAVLGRLGREADDPVCVGRCGQMCNRRACLVSPSWPARRQARRHAPVAAVSTLRDFPIAINMRQPVLVRIMPNRITLYTKGADGLIHNRFSLVASNRGSADATVTLLLADLPAVRLLGTDAGLTLKPGETLQREFDVAGSETAVNPGVNHLRILAHVDDGQKDETFAETFIAPMETVEPVANQK